MIRKTAAFFFLIIIAAFLLCVSVSAENPVIVIDAGHGGYDGGTAQGIRTEKEYNLLLAQYLYDELTADGRFDVYMTRTTDVYLKYLPRVLAALETNADLLISMHCNSNPESYPNGNMAYITVIDDCAAWDLAGMLLDGITSSVGIKRGSVETREDTGDSLGVYYWDSTRRWDMPAAWHLGKKATTTPSTHGRQSSAFPPLSWSTDICPIPPMPPSLTRTKISVPWQKRRLRH